MHKTRTAKVLSAAALANMAAVGLAASPATASTHHAGGAADRAAATALKSHGFVPQASKGVRPNSESGCNGNMCLSLHGGGNKVSWVAEDFAGVAGCHIPWVSVWEGGTRVANIGPGPYICSQQVYRVNFGSSWPTGTDFCGHFQNVPGNVCEPVR
jgi:hypothetical protein